MAAAVDVKVRCRLLRASGGVPHVRELGAAEAAKREGGMTLVHSDLLDSLRSRRCGPRRVTSPAEGAQRANSNLIEFALLRQPRIGTQNCAMSWT